ncbi:LptF/LptG family permease [Salinispira pacifica]|uniref:Permease YjgP/YjgQ family protein n=1 Tax=Salinispira pacifica TaxID=1307761 RepID=V5WJ35_9SPIO|nr:LptF/LptG family permease [Salinispira pacifica]AHC15181.1 hypothetical protein L21SP2_1806 [Salinispira pacifica]
MRVLTRLLLRNFIPIFLGALAFFTILINASDLFVNIVRYIEREVPFFQILLVQWYYLPTCIVFSTPIALLFSVSYSMGTLYSNNELIAVFASGISLKRFILPLIIISAFISIGLFAFQDRFAIPMLREKEELSTSLLRNRPQNLNQANITIQTRGGEVIYRAGYYDHGKQRLDDVTIVRRNEEMLIHTQIRAEWAQWEDDGWVFHRATVLRRKEDEDGFEILDEARFSAPDFDLEPENFTNQFGEIDAMRISEARNYIQFLRESGFPYRKDLTRYHERFSFAFTPLIVTILSAAIGGSYKKNILAMSLLVSLGLSIVYYSIQMLSGLFASIGLIGSVTGAWAGTLITGLAAVYILSRAKT